MKTILRNFLINLFSLWTAGQLISGFVIRAGPASLLLVATGQTFLFIFLKPLIRILMLPISIVTLGTSAMLINAILLYILDYLFDDITVSSWTFQGLSYDGFVIPEMKFGIIVTYIITALLISIVTTFLHWVRK